MIFPDDNPEKKIASGTSADFLRHIRTLRHIRLILEIALLRTFNAICYVAARRLDGSTPRAVLLDPLLLDPLEQHSKIFSFYVAARRLEGSTGQFCMESWQEKKKKYLKKK